MEHQDNMGVKESNINKVGTRQMEKMPMTRFENPPPVIQMSVIPLGCPPLFYPKPIPQGYYQITNYPGQNHGYLKDQNTMMRMPCVPPLMPPSLIGNPTSVQPYPDYTIHYGFVSGPETTMKDSKSSTEALRKSLNKAHKAGKSTEVSVTEKFCSIAKEHGLTVELVKNDELPESSEVESPKCPLNTTKSNFYTFDSSEALRNQPHLNPLVDEYIPHPCALPKNQETVDLILNSSNNSDQLELATEKNLSTTKSMSGNDVETDLKEFKIIGKPPLRLLQLPNMPKVKKNRISRDASVQTDGEDDHDGRLCPTCQGRLSGKCSVAPIFKNISLEQKTKYLALHASFLKDSSTVKHEDWKIILKKKLKMLYKQFGTKDTDVSDWEDELICQVLIGLLDDSPALAAPDQNSLLLTRLREEVNVLNEITASLLEDRPLKVTEKSEPQLSDEPPLVATIAAKPEETLQHSATKSALVPSQGPALVPSQGPAKVGGGVHLSNSSSGVSLSSAELSIGQTVLAAVSSTALDGYKTATVSLSKQNETAEPMQGEKPPTFAIPYAKDDALNLPAEKDQSQTYPPSLKSFFDSLAASAVTKSCSTTHINHPSCSSSQNDKPHIQDKNVPGKMVSSVELKLKDSGESSHKSEDIQSALSSHSLGNTLENRQLKTQSSTSKKVVKLISKCESESQILNPVEKNNKMNNLGYSRDSIKGPCEEAQKLNDFEKAETLWSRIQSEASVTSNKHTLSTLKVSENNVVEVKGSSVHCEVDEQVRDQAKGLGRLSKFVAPDAPTDNKSFLQANPLNEKTQIFWDKDSETLNTPLMQSHNLMLNPPLSVTASSGSIGNISNLGSSSAALFQTSVSSKNTLYHQLSTKSSGHKVGPRNDDASPSNKTEASERNSPSLKGAFNFDKFLQEQRMLESFPSRPYSPSYCDASICAARLDVSPQSVTQHSVLNLQQTDPRTILELQTQQENEKLINLKKKYMDLMMINLQNNPTHGTSIVNFSDPKPSLFLGNMSGPLNFPGISVPTISKTTTSEIWDEHIKKNIEKSQEYEDKRNVGISSFSSCPSASSERSDESSLKMSFKKAPLDVRVRKVSSKGLKCVKDWVAGNVQGQVGTNADTSPKTLTADNRSHAAGEENSVYKSATLYYRKQLTVSSPEDRKTAPLFSVQDINEFNRATPLPDYTKNVYTPQCLLEKYRYSSVAARFIALISTGSPMSLSWSNVSNVSPERHSYAAIIKSTPLKTPAIYSSEPTYSSCSTECPEKEGDLSMRSAYFSSIKEETERSLTDAVNWGNHNYEKSDRTLENAFKFHEKNTEVPQTGDCKINLMVSNLDHKKINQTLDWFDVDDISFFESVSSSANNNILTHKSVFNDDRINKNYMDDDSVIGKSKISGLEDTNWWEVDDGEEEVNRKTEEVKPETRERSRDNNQAWMKVTKAKKQKVSICDRIKEFRQQEKYKNLTTRILEIHTNLTRVEAQDILETVFTVTDGMAGMRQPQILAEVQAAVSEHYPEKANAQKEINLNISGKYCVTKTSKDVKKTVKSRKRSPLSSENVSSAIDNFSSAPDRSSNDLPHTTAWNKNKQVCFENASNLSQTIPNVVSSGHFWPRKCDSIKIDGPECVVSDRADEAINPCAEHDLKKSNILVGSDNVLKATNNVDSNVEYDSELHSLVNADNILSVSSDTCHYEDADTNNSQAFTEDEKDHYFKKACCIQ